MPGKAVMRMEGRREVSARLLQHYCGEHRPEHAERREGWPPVVALRGGDRTAAEMAEEARQCRSRHKALAKASGLPGRVPGATADLLFAGPPPFLSSSAWTRDLVEKWAERSVEWLERKLATASRKARLLGAWLHTDERSPHVHVTITTELDDSSLGYGKLVAGMAAGRQATVDRVSKKELSAAMSELQTSYAMVCGSPFLLERGKEGSTARHHRPDHEAPFEPEPPTIPLTPEPALLPGSRGRRLLRHVPGLGE